MFRRALPDVFILDIKTLRALFCRQNILYIFCPNFFLFEALNKCCRGARGQAGFASVRILSLQCPRQIILLISAAIPCSICCSGAAWALQTFGFVGKIQH